VDDTIFVGADLNQISQTKTSYSKNGLGSKYIKIMTIKRNNNLILLLLAASFLGGSICGAADSSSSAANANASSYFVNSSSSYGVDGTHRKLQSTPCPGCSGRKCCLTKPECYWDGVARKCWLLAATPTPPPTPPPSSPPTTLQIVFSGTGSPPNPLPECHGDCDNDSECQGDLRCFQRSTTEAVPGCPGQATSGVDFCARRPSEDTVWLNGDNGSPAANFPLGLCEGDCDSDTDCQSGLIW